MSSAEADDDILRDCIRAVEAHRGHPTIVRWFHAVTTFEAPMPGLGVGCFPMIEFRDGQQGAVVWSDGPDTWGTGGWHPLTPAGTLPSDAIQTPPVAHGLGFGDVLDVVAGLRREGASGRRTWWRFW
jgi:hypothetical protein